MFNSSQELWRVGRKKRRFLAGGAGQRNAVVEKVQRRFILKCRVARFLLARLLISTLIVKYPRIVAA